uniref:Uncharacterized protein n=1 Tax=Lotus japonicus TaxID=34305 RepID=I3SMH1_LOTJA|nr:unknown [Lotus japonicus]
MSLLILNVQLLSSQQKRSPSNRLGPKIDDGNKVSQYAYPYLYQIVQSSISSLAQNHLHFLNGTPYKTQF